MGDVFLAGTVNNLKSVVWIPMVMAWLNGCIATELKDERKWYLFTNGNDRRFPRTKAAVCCSTVTKLNICPDQIYRDQIWYSGTLPISKTTHELKFNRLVGPMWAKQIYCTISYENDWCIFPTSRRFVLYRIDILLYLLFLQSNVQFFRLFRSFSFSFSLAVFSEVWEAALIYTPEYQKNYVVVSFVGNRRYSLLFHSLNDCRLHFNNLRLQLVNYQLC